MIIETVSSKELVSSMNLRSREQRAMWNKNIWKNKAAAVQVTTPDGQQQVRYHDTSVVTWDDNHIVLFHGGWKTATIKMRMNEVSELNNLSFRVHQKSKNWYVAYGGTTIQWADDMPYVAIYRRCNVIAAVSDKEFLPWTV